LLASGCTHGTEGLFPEEVDFLAEDVIDLMTIVFQTGENAFVGDLVDPADVVDPAGPGNAFTVTYDLPFGFRLGLGDGLGRASLSVTEDGVPVADPLAFSLGTSAALEVEITYELRYQGETAGGRATDFDLVVSLIATRATPADPFDADYLIDGTCDMGDTSTGITVGFTSPGRPRDGVDPGSGDGSGFVDDPDVVDVFDLDLDWLNDFEFRAKGDVGFCCFFRETFDYGEVF